MNPYVMNNNQSGNFNPNMNPEYTTYSNPYVDNPQFNPYEDMPNSNMNAEFENNSNNNNMNNMNNQMNNIPMIPMMPPNMMYPGMFPPNMMYPGMMFPGTVPPNMMYPAIMPNMPTINMDEFDEEEM